MVVELRCRGMSRPRQGGRPAAGNATRVVYFPAGKGLPRNAGKVLTSPEMSFPGRGEGLSSAPQVLAMTRGRTFPGRKCPSPTCGTLVPGRERTFRRPAAGPPGPPEGVPTGRRRSFPAWRRPSPGSNRQRLCTHPLHWAKKRRPASLPAAFRSRDQTQGQEPVAGPAAGSSSSLSSSDSDSSSSSDSNVSSGSSSCTWDDCRTRSAWKSFPAR